jgi:hypothetical protein
MLNAFWLGLTQCAMDCSKLALELLYGPALSFELQPLLL